MSTLQKLTAVLRGQRSYDLSELLRGGAVAILFKLAGIGCLFLLNAVITNQFGKANFGDYTFFVSTIKVMAVLAVFGTDIYSLRHNAEFISKKLWGSVRRLTQSAYRAVALTGAVLTGLVLLSSPLIAEALEVPLTYVILGALMIYPFSMINYHLQCFRSEKNILFFAGINFFLIPFLSLVLIGVFLLLRDHLALNVFWIPIWAHVITVLTLSVLAIVLWQRGIRRRGAEADNYGPLKEALSITSTLRNGFPFLLASTSVFFASWIIQFGLRYVHGSESLADYEIAFRIGILTVLPLMAVNAIAAPKFSDFFGRGKLAELERTAQYATLLTIVGSLCIAVVIYLFPVFLLQLFGENFDTALPVLLIITVAHLVNAVAGPNGNILLMSDNQGLFKNIVLFSSGSTALLSLWLVTQYGAVGAALSYTFFSVLNNGLQIFFVKRKLDIVTFPLGLLVRRARRR